MSDELEAQYPRRIIVDDTDPRITYDTGSWDFDGSAFVNSNGLLGDPYNKTMRGTNSAKASLTFTFEGDYIQVRGARDNRKIPPPNDTGLDRPNDFPEFTCQIDNELEPFPRYATYYKFYTTNVPLCEKANLSKGRHTLTMTIMINDPNRQVFWLDSIEYSPLPTADLTKEITRVYSNDPRSWMNTTSASISFRFNGTSISLYGSDLWGSKSLEDPPPVGTTGSYRVDNEQSVQFTIPGSEALPLDRGNVNGYGWYNKRLFIAESLDGNKEHEIVVSYNGNNGGTGRSQPLLIDYLLVGNHQPQSDSSSSGSGEAGESGNSGKVSVGGIVGGVVGGIFVIIAIAVLVWFLRKRKRQSDFIDERGVVEPFDTMAVVRSRPPVLSQTLQSTEGTETTHSTYSSPLAGNFERLKQAQREAINTAPRQELDSGLRYGRDVDTTTSSHTTVLPPVYTAE
ncbi:hypothetical protein AAF712_015594 [Marasmius tenuissimus]|uniref:Uncharacterized protein n=1 Tax=Marasmius tenuissimus TaxID=585030 RepID=A0ABR2Z954_9AGAR|nr:hypothetical protein PM082_024205 [Marasmius tenuissimus]